MLVPIMIGNAEANVIAPDTESACKMPIEAADDCMIAVNTYAHHYLAHVLCLVLLSHHYDDKTDNDKYRREI